MAEAILGPNFACRKRDEEGLTESRKESQQESTNKPSRVIEDKFQDRHNKPINAAPAEFDGVHTLPITRPERDEPRPKWTFLDLHFSAIRV